MNIKRITVCLSLLLSSASFADAVSQGRTPSTKFGQTQRAAKSQPQHEDDGEHIFQQNCSRCHNTPEGFSSSISGTVIKHMRVRASLSKEDEKQLLRFLNP